MIEPYTGKDIQPYCPTVIDIETAPDGTVIGVGFIWSDNYGHRKYSVYDNIRHWYDAYCVLLASVRNDKHLQKRLTRIYAHNGSNFDYLSFYEYFSATREICEGIYFTADSTGIGVSFTLRRAKKKVAFLDSYRLLPASLAGLTKTFHVDHVKQEVPEECKDNYLLFKETYPALFWQYLEHDVRGLQEVIYQFWTQIYELFGNVGHLPMTLPSLTLRIFSKQLQEPIFVPSDKALKTLEREAYKGGLTLCLRTGIFDNVNVYDVNSMYPAQMRVNSYPTSYIGYWSKNYESQSMGLWRATFEQTRRNVPPLLFDNEKGAAYSGSGVYTTNELNYLRDMGGTFTVSEGYIYIKSEPLFAEFIDKLYKLRKKAILLEDDALAFVLKIMMNSLYGKFAQREKGDTIIYGSGKKFKELIDTNASFRIMGDFFVIEEERDVRHAFVAIAAMITANARIDLHKRMTEVINAGYDVYYCDTDSIHTNGHFNTSDELGDIKLENSGRAAYAGRKLYAFEGGKAKAKGIGRKITQGALNFETIAKLALDKEALESITFDRFPSVKGVLSQKEKAAVIRSLTRRIRNTGGVWDDETSI